MVVDSLDGTVSGNQLARSDFSDTLDSGYIVGRVSADGKHVYDLQRGLDSVS